MAQKKSPLGVINGTETGQAIITFLKNVSSKEMVGFFQQIGLIDVGDEEYGFAFCVDRLSENAVAYILAKMVEEFTPTILNEFDVAEGTYKGHKHIWIRVSEAPNLVIDPSLAQFEEDRVPDIAIVDTNYNEHYDVEETEVFGADEWLETMAAYSDEIHLELEDYPVVAELATGKPKTYSYEVGGGIYEYPKPISAIELFTLILTEFDGDVQLDNGLELPNIKDEADAQDIRTRIDKTLEQLEQFNSSAAK